MDNQMQKTSETKQGNSFYDIESYSEVLRAKDVN